MGEREAATEERAVGRARATPIVAAIQWMWQRGGEGCLGP